MARTLTSNEHPKEIRMELLSPTEGGGCWIREILDTFSKFYT